MGVVALKVTKPRLRRLLLKGLVLGITLYFVIDLLRWTLIRYVPRLTSMFWYNLWKWSLVPCGFLKTPFVQMIGTSSVMIMWETNCRFDDAELFYTGRPAHLSGPKQQFYNDNVSEHSLAADSIEILVLGKHRFVHKVYLDRLYSDNHYRYIVRLAPEGVAINRKQRARTTGETTPFLGSFYFPGELAESLTIGVISDNHGGSETFNQLLNSMSKQKPNLFLHLGDMVQQPLKRLQWQVFFFDALMRSGIAATIPSLITMGNHDITQYGYSEYFSPANRLSFKSTKDDAYDYAVTLGPARIIFLDCNNEESEAQLSWLQSELSSSITQKAVFRIVCIHYAPFIEYWDPVSWGKGGESGWSTIIRTRMIPLFEKYHVDLVLSGHQHNYQRGFKNGIHYVTSGGGGGQLDTKRVEDYRIFKKTKFVHHYLLLSISKNFIELKVNDQFSRHLDSFSIPKNVIRRYRAPDS